MSINQKYQQGFTPIEGLLIVLVLAVVAFGGYYVWHSQQVTLTTAKSGTVNSKTPIKTTNNIVTATKYLTITQWGIRAPYVSTDTLSYIINSTNSNLATIVSKNLSDNFDCPGANNQDSGAGIISRNLATATPDIMTTARSYAQLATSDPTDYKLIGNYVYGFGHDQAACYAEPTTAGSSAQNASENLTNSLIPKFEVTPTN